jgi:hypothetical protein
MVVAAFLGLLGGQLSADASEIKYKGAFSGSVMSSEIDTNGDGIKAAIFLVVGDTNLGRTDVQAVVEFAPVGPSTCQNGNSGLLLKVVPGTGNGVIRHVVGRGIATERPAAQGE